MNSQIEKLIQTPMSDQDLRNELGNDITIVTYGQLDEFETIDDLLGKNNFAIILIETEIRSGHWECVLKYDNIVEHFDAYAFYPDASLRLVDRWFRIENDEYIPHLTRLYDKCPYKVIYNTDRLQAWNPRVATCGRWCCARVKMFRKGIDIVQFDDWINKQCKIQQTTPDILVTKLIN